MTTAVDRLALRYFLPNLRLGGQVELMRSALTELRRRGVDADAILPPGVDLEDRTSLARYAHGNSWRGKAGHLRSLRVAVIGLPRECLVAVVLPSPALLPFGRWLARGKRAIFHFEGDGATVTDSLRELFGGNPGAALRMSLTNPRMATPQGAAEVFVVGTEAAASRIAARSGGGRPIVLPQACDWIPPEVAVGDARMRLGLPPDRPLVGYAGHPFANKGFDVLVDAFRVVRRDRPEALLVIASSGEGRRLGAAEDRIHLGITDVPLFLRAIDVLVLPYRTLASTTLPPTLLLEAMAVGVPIIASDLPDLREVAPDGEVVFVAPGSAVPLAREIEGLLGRGERSDEMRSRQKRRTAELQERRSRSKLWDLLGGDEAWAGRNESEAARSKAQHYDRGSVARSYDARRFGGPGGRYVDEKERRAVEELVDGLTGSAVDLPSGTGRAFPVLAARGFRVFGADASISMIHQARREGRALAAAVSDAFRTPFRSGSFDLVLTVRFFFHLPNPEALLREVSRLLRPGGHFVFDSLLWSPRSILPFLQRGLGGLVYPRPAAEVEEVLRSHGFAVKKTISLFALPSQIYRYFPGFAIPWARTIDGASSRGTKTFYLAWKTSSSE